jgi:uncharacterized RDD family membrane protein YckC
MTAEDRGVTRDLFWRRLAAALIDVVVLVLLGSFAAVALYAASGGALRSTTLLQTTRCAPVTAISERALEVARLPPGFRPNAAAVCVQSFLGVESGRYLVMSQRTPGQPTISLSRPIDAAGRAVAPKVLDWTYPLAFILVMAGLEAAFGATLGKRALGLKVTAETGGRLGLHRALLRNVVIYGAWAVVLTVPLLSALLRVRLSHAGYIAAVAVFGALGWAPLFMLAQAAPRALYDRWAGAEVIRP